MSTNLYWAPAPKHRTPRQLDQLKFIISQYLFGHDGSLRSDPVIVNESHVMFLKGVIAGVVGPFPATAKEAEELIEAILKHGEVELWIDA